VSGVAAMPLPVVFLYGCRHRVSECARCELVRPVWYRGLCRPCVDRCRLDGTIGCYGYVKADRMADFAWLRLGGVDVAGAAGRVGVSERTGWRYETELAGSGRAPWREWPCAA